MYQEFYFSDSAFNKKLHRESRTSVRVEPQSAALNILKKKLEYELDFYHFIKKIFYDKFSSLLTKDRRHKGKKTKRKH